jgi:hypothetical protein
MEALRLRRRIRKVPTRMAMAVGHALVKPLGTPGGVLSEACAWASSVCGGFDINEQAWAGLAAI